MYPDVEFIFGMRFEALIAVRTRVRRFAGMHSDVATQYGLIAEETLAVLALVGFFAGVNISVTFQPVLVDETFIAVFATEGFIALMSHHVIFQQRLRVERFVAHIANEVFSVRVNFNVFLKVGRRTVRFLADITYVRILTGVRFQVLLQVFLRVVVRFAVLAYEQSVFGVVAAQNVAFQIRPLAETLQADLAHIRFVTGVRFQVSQQFFLRFEMLHAILALEFTLFGVVTPLNVALEIGELRERSQTVLTLIRFLSGMHSHVPRKGGVIAEHFLAAGTLERAFACVSSDVRIKITFLAEAAITVRANERFRTFVQFHVLS